MNQGAEHQQIVRNIEAVQAFTQREAQKLSRSQRLLEHLSHLIGRPLFFGSILLFVLVWMLANGLMRRIGLVEFDSPPYFWLQGLIGLCALLATTVVLSRQSRLARLADQLAHLDLKVTLLTEQKVAKLIDLLEELRRDLPNVKNRLDTGADALQQAMDPHRVLAALDEYPLPDPAGAASSGSPDRP